MFTRKSRMGKRRVSPSAAARRARNWPRTPNAFCCYADDLGYHCTSEAAPGMSLCDVHERLRHIQESWTTTI
jgi:hypothetical protein